MFKYNYITALFPSLISPPPPPPIYSFHLIFSPCCVISALYITAAHSSNPLFFIYLFVTSPSFLFLASLPPVLLFSYFAPHTHFFFLLPHFSFINISSLTPLSHTSYFYMYIYPLFFKIFELLIIFSYLDGMETILLPYSVERVVSVLLSVHCITTSAPFV